MWAPVGVQPQVPAPGQNEKQVVYGGVDYATGKIVYTVAATKSGVNFLAFLVALVAAYAGRKIRLVCDNGRFHSATISSLASVGDRRPFASHSPISLSYSRRLAFEPCSPR